MSTQFYSPSQETPNQQSPRHQGNGPSRSRFWIAIVAVGAVAVAAIIALAVTLTGSHSTTTTPGGTSSPAATSPANPSTPPSHGSTPSGGTTPAKPSAAVEKLQQELGQLNYYEGPVDGVMGPQTIAAIKDLQRQANLPQTGTMNAATTAALANYLAHGNNNMNS
jgi:peptidoglycan hydrolase-like protein with peptidoglycan-binding domain